MYHVVSPTKGLDQRQLMIFTTWRSRASNFRQGAFRYDPQRGFVFALVGITLKRHRYISMRALSPHVLIVSVPFSTSWTRFLKWGGQFSCIFIWINFAALTVRELVKINVVGLVGFWVRVLFNLSTRRFSVAVFVGTALLWSALLWSASTFSVRVFQYRDIHTLHSNYSTAFIKKHLQKSTLRFSLTLPLH